MYLVEIEYSNGYRCCCTRSWDHTEQVATLDEALAFVPIELINGETLQFNGDMEVRSVTVTDEATGEEIASGQAHWSYGGLRGSRYAYTLWSVYRPEGHTQTVYDGARRRVDKEWDECLAELAAKRKAYLARDS